MPLLGVNIDHIATLREVRHGNEPDPVFAALICQSAGADSIVAHLREDRRHIRERDVCLLKQLVQVKFNLEMSIASRIVRFACELAPDQVTLVPERRQELTTEGGLDAAGNFTAVKAAIGRLKKAGCEVSLFLDPEKKQIDASLRLGVRMIELHTGRYADARDRRSRDRRYAELKSAARYAKGKGLRVFAGHGLDYSNVARIAAIPQIEELNIGYSIVCRAALSGLHEAVREMKRLSTP